MALPAATTFAECADIQKSFLDFLPQLYALPQKVFENLTDIEALKSIYLSTNPVISALAATIALFPVYLLVSEFNRNYSQVDRSWSILPTLFNIHYSMWARLSGLPTQRVDHVLAASMVWSLRLSYNYWRKGGYDIGSEDYRWKIIQSKIGKAGFFVFNVLFISSWQLFIIWSITTPTYLLLLTINIQPEITTTDSTFARLITSLVVIEHFADQQMWDYQQAKASYKATAKLPPGWSQVQMERGFITTGLWQWIRHPNFVAEQAVWVALYAWGCWMTGTYWNWTIIGTIQYLAVFQGSTPLTEWITRRKYPEYAIYQQRVGRLLPNLFGPRWNEAESHRIAARMAEGNAKKVK